MGTLPEIVNDVKTLGWRVVEPDLVSVAEVALMLGVSRPRVTQLSKTPDFPEPVVRLQAGPIWRREDVEAWARETGRL